MARVLLVLLGSAAIATLGTAVWLAFLDTRSEAVTVTDPRQIYVNNIRQKIQAATEAALAVLPPQDRTGSPLLRIQVNHRGALISVTVARSSGHPALDELAQRIVREAAPFEPFPPDVRRTTQVMEINSTFYFK